MLKSIEKSEKELSGCTFTPESFKKDYNKKKTAPINDFAQ